MPHRFKWRLTHLLLIMLLPLFVIFPSICSCSSGTPLDLVSIDHFIQSQMRAHGIVGLSVAITRGDQIMYLAGYGKAGNGRAMTPQTPTYLASVSKSFTALAVMQLVQEGRIDLDAPVQTYLPWFRVADPQAAGQITIRRLLHQTSGLTDLTYQPTLPLDASVEELARDLSRAQVYAPPGTAFYYFNPNYSLLGLILAKVTGQSYPDYIQEHIFRPLQMHHSYALLDLAQQDGMADGYGPIFGIPFPRREQLARYELPAGFLISSAEDMAHYLIAQNNGGIYNGTRILTEEGVQEMHRPDQEVNSHYAMGWYSGERWGTQAMWHGGDLFFYHAEMALLPEEGYGIVLLSNQNSLPHSFIAFNMLLDGLVRLLRVGQASTPFGLLLFYGVLDMLILLSIVSEVRWWHRFGRWREHAQARPHLLVLIDIAWNLVFPALLLVGLPALIAAVLHRGFGWGLALGLWPDMVVWAWLAALTALCRGVVKGWAVWRWRQRPTSG